MNKIILNKNEVETFLENYTVGSLISFELMEKGQANTTYLFTTSKGKYVCKLYHNETSQDILNGSLKLKELRDNNFPCIHIIPTKENSLISELKRKTSTIYEYIQGEHITNPAPKHLQEVAKTLARLHLLTKSKEGAHKRELISKEDCLAQAKKRLDKIKNKKLQSQRLEFFTETLQQITDSQNLPRGIIHGDYSQENILFLDNNISAVIDFDASNQGPFILDLASIIYFWAWFLEPKRQLNLTKARDVLREYQKVRKLTKSEKLYLYDALVLRTITYLSWNIDETDYEKEIKTNYYEYFKALVEQVTSIGREDFYNKLFK